MLFAAAVTALSLLSAASAQSPMVIQVGAEATTNGGIFQFIPPSITASNGTVVTFRFTGAPGNHTVTQSSLTDPCDPVSGGFDSGWVFVPPSPALSPTPEWNITITNDQRPIWFYCKQLLPGPHCSAGMVGAINAPPSGNASFASYLANAKNAKSSGQGEGGLVGIAASASAGVESVSGASYYTGATASATGSGSSPSQTSPGGSGAAPSTTASASTNVVANTLLSLFAAALGIVLV